MVRKAEGSTRPGGDQRPGGRIDGVRPGAAKTAGHRWDGGGAAPGRVGAGGDIHAKKVTIKDGSKTGDTKVTQKSGDTTVKDKSRNMGDVAPVTASTGDNTVPVSAVPGG